MAFSLLLTLRNSAVGFDDRIFSTGLKLFPMTVIFLVFVLLTLTMENYVVNNIIWSIYVSIMKISLDFLQAKYHNFGIGTAGLPPIFKPGEIHSKNHI